MGRLFLTAFVNEKIYHLITGFYSGFNYETGTA